MGVAVTGGFVFAADVSLGFMTIAAPTPTPPPVTGTYDSPGYVRGVSVVPPYAYIADAGYLRVVDISDPDSPTLVESANTRDRQGRGLRERVRLRYQRGVRAFCGSAHYSR